MGGVLDGKSGDCRTRRFISISAGENDTKEDVRTERSHRLICRVNTKGKGDSLGICASPIRDNQKKPPAINDGSKSMGSDT